MTKVALLIGISDYEPGLNPLPASVKDMQAIAKVLQSTWHFPFLPPQVQPQHRVEIPSQPESSSSHQVTTPKTHNPKLKARRQVIAVSFFLVGAFLALAALKEGRPEFLIFGILLICLGIVTWKL